jgi:hypothetical protein
MKNIKNKRNHSVMEFSVILIAITFLSFTAPGVSRDFTIVSKGQPKAEIIVADQSQPPLAFAAKELQRYLKEMSGAKLEVASSQSKHQQLS